MAQSGRGGGRLEGTSGNQIRIIDCNTGNTITTFGSLIVFMAADTLTEYPFGLVRIEFMGETTAGRVIFAAPGTQPLLGVTALESVGIIVDPTNKTLKRLPAIPLK
jgi:hypothetical protein